MREKLIGSPVWLRHSAALIALSVSASLPALAVTSVKDAAVRALETNPDVQASFHEYMASVAEKRGAVAGYLPTVSIDHTSGSADREFDARGRYSTSYSGVNFTQMLFDGFGTSSEVKRLDGVRLVRYFELLNTVESTALDAVRAYDDVRTKRELVALARANYEKHRDVYEQIAERAQSGVGRKVDLEQIAGRLALAESNLLTEASNLHDVSARYLRVVGDLPPATQQALTFSSSNLPSSVRDVLQMAYQGNPGFHAAVRNISAASAAVNVERSRYLPRAELRARGTDNRNINSFHSALDPETRGQESAVELALTYDLYAGGAHSASKRRAYEKLNQAKDLRDQACVDLRQNTQIAYNDTLRLKERLTALAQHKASSDKVRIAYADQFNIGQRTLLDLLDAENEFFQASRNLVMASSEYEIAHARTLAAMGRLLPALDIAKEQLSVLEEIVADDKVIASKACPDLSPDGLGRDDLISDMTPLSGDALFSVNSSELRAGARALLDRLIADIKATPNVTDIVIEGHTDNTGSDSINIPLSEARAKRVKDYFILNGLDSTPITAAGFGATKPVKDNSTDEGKAANRRVEITVRSQPSE